MTANELRRRFPNASPDFIKDNADDSRSLAVGGLAPSPAKPTVVQTLDGGKPQRKKSKGRVAVVVTLISCRRRLSDDDAIAASCKHLRDHIASTLGLDDGDARIKFQYAQIQTSGKQGVLVRIEMV